LFVQPGQLSALWHVGRHEPNPVAPPPQPWRELGTHFFMNGQQKPCLHCTLETQLPQVPTNFFLSLHIGPAVPGLTGRGGGGLVGALVGAQPVQVLGQRGTTSVGCDEQYGLSCAQVMGPERPRRPDGLLSWQDGTVDASVGGSVGVVVGAADGSSVVDGVSVDGTSVGVVVRLGARVGDAVSLSIGLSTSPPEPEPVDVQTRLLSYPHPVPEVLPALISACVHDRSFLAAQIASACANVLPALQPYVLIFTLPPLGLQHLT